MTEWIERFKRNIEQMKTHSLLWMYRGLYANYVEYVDIKDDIKMDIIENEILKRTGELKTETITKCRSNF